MESSGDFGQIVFVVDGGVWGSCAFCIGWVIPIVGILICQVLLLLVRCAVVLIVGLDVEGFRQTFMSSIAWVAGFVMDVNENVAVYALRECIALPATYFFYPLLPRVSLIAFQLKPETISTNTPA